MACNLTKICDDIGMSEGAVAYVMEARSIKVPAVLAKMADSEEDFVTKVYKPWQEGRDFKGKKWPMELASTKKQ